MTIINLAGDGLHSQVIILARVVVKHGPIDKDELITVCAAPSENGKDRDVGRLRAALARWIDLGLFLDDGSGIRLNVRLNRGETLDEFTDRLPIVCRQLILQPQHCLPLWASNGDVTEEGVGRVADFARSLSWVLAQDIYRLPNAAGDIDALVRTQVTAPRFIFLNETRWPGMRVWARYLGFATGDDSNFLLDPTDAVGGELPHILTKGRSTPADAFIHELSVRLPVLDGGAYREEVESILRTETWRRPAEGHLSMSLSMALRRLELSGLLALETKADAGTSIGLTGRDYRTWARFTHVRLHGDTK
jgi:hypothetical protein